MIAVFSASFFALWTCSRIVLLRADVLFESFPIGCKCSAARRRAVVACSSLASASGFRRIRSLRTTFSNSRIFPGHSYVSRASRKNGADCRNRVPLTVLLKKKLR